MSRAAKELAGLRTSSKTVTYHTEISLDTITILCQYPSYTQEDRP